jgi:RHS repeat-associated protein
MLDNLGLVHMNGRVYDSSIGRFMSTDPFVGRLSSSQTKNPYSYVNNSPQSSTDPSGFFSLGSLLNPFSNDNPLNPFGKLGGKIAAFPFTSSLAALEFGKKQNDSLLRDNTWLQPIAQFAACYWGGPLACDASSAYLTRLNGGSIGQSLIAFVVTDASAAAYAEVGTGNWATDALATGAIGGTASSLTGGSFTRGFEFAAGASIAGSLYTHYTNQDPQWGPGENRPGVAPCEQAGSSCYVMDNGEIPRSFGNGNLWGLDRPLTGRFWDDFFVQSGPLSSVMDQVPSMQAVAMIHDIWNPNWLTTVPLMFPAVGITWGALLNNYWLVPGYNATRH